MVITAQRTVITITTIIIVVFMVTSHRTSRRMIGTATVIVVAETNGMMEVISWRDNTTNNHISM